MSLTADLAFGNVPMNELDDLRRQLAAAEQARDENFKSVTLLQQELQDWMNTAEQERIRLTQARDEALKDAQGYSEQTAQVWRDNDRLKHEAHSAARTALLEAAKEIEKEHTNGRPDQCRDCSKWGPCVVHTIISWLTARAGGKQ